MSRPEPVVIPFAMQRMACSKCGAETNAACNCGVNYRPVAERVADYDKANPGRSTRQVAADLGVSQPTVVEARKSGDRRLSPATVTGRDGKIYPATRALGQHIITAEQRKAEYADDDNGPALEPDDVAAHSAFLIRADAAARAAFYALGKIDNEIVSAAEETAEMWKRLHHALKGGQHVEAEEE